MNRIPDNFDMWEAYERGREKRLASLPICADCGEPIQEDHFYLINDEAICPTCLEAGYRKEVDDYVS